MATSSIKISQLAAISSITNADFFPIDQSSSLTTYRGTVSQLGTLFATGSRTGSHTGSFLGVGTAPQFVGTASYALTASFINSSSYALSASYAPTSNINGTGVVNYLPNWVTTTTLGSSYIYYTGSRTSYRVDGQNWIVQNNSGQAFLVVNSAGINSNLYLESANSASDSWAIVVGTSGSGADRGVIEWNTYSGSNNLASKQGTTTSDGIVKTLTVRSNGYYFWPNIGADSISRDGTVSISYDPTSAFNTSSKLLLNIYSGSSASFPQTNHIRKAIEVTYGSGSSYSTTFCVSSSGFVYASGYNVISSSGYTYTGSIASGSFAVIEDAGNVFLFARSANGRLRSASLA